MEKTFKLIFFSLCIIVTQNVTAQINTSTGGSGAVLANSPNSNTNVGIGTANPQSKLDVKGNITVGSNYAGVSVAPTNGAIIEGNMGIGTNSPNGKLEIKGNSAVYSDFANYNGTTINNSLPNGKIPTLIVNENPSGTLIYATGGQKTYRGGMSFGIGGPGIYSVNDNPAGSQYYGDIRFHTTYWNGSNYNNADRMVINGNNGNVGIGTISPESKLEIKSDVANTSGLKFTNLTNSSPTSNVSGRALSVDAAGNVVLVQAVTGFIQTLYNDDGLLDDNRTVNTNGNNLNFSSFNGNSQFFINGNSGNIGIGTTSSLDTADNKSYRLSVKGRVRAEEVKVYNTWADYVFNKNYQLPTLTEVEKYIEQNKHLPNVPSAKEVTEKGLELGEMAKIQQEKIEELTLYLIQQNKQIEELKAQVKLLMEKK